MAHDGVIADCPRQADYQALLRPVPGRRRRQLGPVTGQRTLRNEGRSAAGWSLGIGRVIRSWDVHVEWEPLNQERFCG